ncbi:hypothetical protein Csp2054_03595 [Curtobacterium sp. 'Ferrero']|uniref:DUF2142 domain-containing protein n=1 Tax=Curtobacterium sp. 'Ferrero' TaxID=2033654 RepID=UPI000BD1CB74|nr:DUF2142 domain-containing protein [Curtobacterium sp. 'Ferrero']PCN49274.1 hypothetical protein Csp2054_03595 [Curtobacterium sp. 'Ferrero']
MTSASAPTHRAAPDPHRTVSTRAERWTIAVLTVAFGLWLALWAVLVPAFQAPDEVAHLDAAIQLATGAGWPAPGSMHVTNAVLAAVQEQATRPASGWSTVTALLSAHPGVSTTVNQMSQHPPTAYLVDAGLLRVLHFGSLRWDHALVALRLADALAVTPLALLAWASVRRVTRSPRAGLLGAVALFAVPQLASIAASVTNDAPVLLLGGVVVWLTVRLLTGDMRRRVLAGLAVALGLLVSVKGTGLPAVPFVGLAVLVAGADRSRLGVRALRTVAVLAVAAVIGGWWWVRNVVRYGTVQPDGYAGIRPDQPFPDGSGPSLAHFVDVSWGTLARTFWGSFGGRAQVSIGDTATALLTVLALVVVVGWAFRRRTARGPGVHRSALDRSGLVVLAVFPALLVALQTASSWRAYLHTTQVAGTQGRYFFPAFVALVVLGAVAWRRLAGSDGGRRVVGTVLGVGGPVVGLVGLGIAASWFWNGARGPLTAAGVERYQASGSAPFEIVVVLGVAVAVTLTVGVLRAARTPSDPLD